MYIYFLFFIYSWGPHSLTSSHRFVQPQPRLPDCLKLRTPSAQGTVLLLTVVVPAVREERVALTHATWFWQLVKVSRGMLTVDLFYIYLYISIYIYIYYNYLYIHLFICFVKEFTVHVSVTNWPTPFVLFLCWAIGILKAFKILIQIRCRWYTKCGKIDGYSKRRAKRLVR